MPLFSALLERLPHWTGSGRRVLPVRELVLPRYDVCPRVPSTTDFELACLHEAGHAAAALIAGLNEVSVTLNGRRTEGADVCQWHGRTDYYYPNKTSVQDLLSVDFGGIAAELHFLNACDPRGVGDIMQAAERVQSALPKFQWCDLSNDAWISYCREKAAPAIDLIASNEAVVLAIYRACVRHGPKCNAAPPFDILVGARAIWAGCAAHLRK